MFGSKQNLGEFDDQVAMFQDFVGETPVDRAELLTKIGELEAFGLKAVGAKTIGFADLSETMHDVYTSVVSLGIHPPLTSGQRYEMSGKLEIYARAQENATAPAVAAAKKTGRKQSKSSRTDDRKR